MSKYEYCVLDINNEDELSVEQVLEKIEVEGWVHVDCGAYWWDKESIANEILKEKYIDWQMFEEGDSVFIAVKESVEGKEEIEVYQVCITYTLSTSAEMIFDNDDLRQGK
ncbi:hypothetical protein [Frederiksenia canicola]